MTPALLLTEGALLLVIGMTVVFLFLLLMVAVMNAMQTPITRLNHLLPDPAQAQPKRAPAPAASNDDALVAAAIAVAARR